MNSRPRLDRTLGTRDAVVVGLGAMLGAGVFTALAPAAGAAGSGVVLALALAALVAYCNATASARLAARYPDSGGTYVYGTLRLGPFWGYLAGWGFVVGKIASCAAMALTVVTYAVPGLAQPWRGLVAAGVVVTFTALNYAGVRKSALTTRVLVVFTLAVLGLVVLAVAVGGHADLARATPAAGLDPLGVVEAAGLLFFAFAGYARIATLGEEVRDPQRTIPRAVRTALAVVLAVYLLVTVAALAQLGPSALAANPDPLAHVVETTSWSALAPALRVGAVVAAAGSLLALLLGISRTVLAMSRDGHFPATLTAVHPRFGVPHHAELAVGAVVAVLAATADLRGVIGFSSFAVLIYYAVANASAWTLRTRRLVPAVGLAGCTVLAAGLPSSSIVVGTAVLTLGVLFYGVRAALVKKRR
ncbi:APC family permease [Saccharomonospora xinjiangensis]|uniref:Amino acid transporter n=1 Tax=Saccharomonospora xinjiangensis XJ-54 TaxID=882086 RepID=I0V726_9PSEU|nr:amino acid permease [Saccharomonospora xinjiangensis]EID55929.1 amino acid transporter [Saccharomonospora xinjiangensis XJ-54]